MHDWGDMLVQAGFSEPVMDMERITLTFATPERLLTELRELGRNLHPQRFGALRGRGWYAQLLSRLATLAQPDNDGQLRLTFEVVYGHAFKAPPRIPVGPETRVSLDEMRMTLRQVKKNDASG
jgi:malonyl-CoA O-methyltransferase